MALDNGAQGRAVVSRADELAIVACGKAQRGITGDSDLSTGRDARLHGEGAPVALNLIGTLLNVGDVGLD